MTGSSSFFYLPVFSLGGEQYFEDEKINKFLEQYMPNKPKHPCGYPGCPELIDAGKYYCPKHEKLVKANMDKSRGSAAKRGYGSKWQKARKTFLAKHPLCEECLKKGKTAPATVVDHIIPHRGNMKLFWDVNNWQALCKHHHDAKTAKEVFHGGKGD